MKAEIISIGTELMTGQNLDTNSQWLSRRLCELGIDVHFHTTIGDSLKDNVAAMRLACERTDLVIISGGLGPTLDDLTRDALAAAASVPLEFHEPSFEKIREMFQRRSRPMPERNRVQAMFPAGAEPIPNDLGTAPGIWMTIGKTQIASLPGVPKEMHAMFLGWVRPRLPRGEEGIWERRINTYGVGESVVEEKLKEITARGREPEVGITASEGTIYLRIMSRGESQAAALAEIAPTEQLIRERLGHLVYGVDQEELHDVVARLLIQKKMTLGTAESITAGQVAELLARVPGASDWLRGGIVAYTNTVKTSLLGVSADLIRENGAVSAEVAEAMAIGCRAALGSDIAVSTTGLAGPGDGGEEKPIGTVYVGIAWNGGVTSRQINWFGNRTEIQNRAAKSAINVIRLWLEGQLTSTHSGY